jgi:hypothetical protein
MANNWRNCFKFLLRNSQNTIPQHFLVSFSPLSLSLSLSHVLTFWFSSFSVFLLIRCVSSAACVDDAWRFQQHIEKLREGFVCRILNMHIKLTKHTYVIPHSPSLSFWFAPHKWLSSINRWRLWKNNSLSPWMRSTWVRWMKLMYPLQHNIPLFSLSDTHSLNTLNVMVWFLFVDDYSEHS